MSKKSLSEERDAVDRVTEAMYSLGFLQDITNFNFSADRDKLTVGQFYREWLKHSGAPGPVIPFSLGAILGYLYVGILFTKENWFDLVPEDAIQTADEAWGLKALLWSRRRNRGRR